MGTRNFARYSLLVLPVLCSSLAFAQFQEPSQEELKMTADPKAPGAAAVYLNLQENTDDPLHYHSFYARIKVLQEKGKELATVELPYWHGEFKITDIKGRTIHSDGTVIPLDVKPEDLLITRSGEKQLNRKVFTLPSADVGSILEYSYQLRYEDNHYSSPSWEAAARILHPQGTLCFYAVQSISEGLNGRHQSVSGRCTRRQSQHSDLVEAASDGHRSSERCDGSFQSRRDRYSADSA